MPVAGTGVVKPLVGFISQPPFPEKPTACAVVVKEKAEWQVVGVAKGKHLTAGPRSTEAATGNDTYRPTPSASSKSDSPTSYAKQLRQQNLKYEPSFEKAEKLHQLKEALKARHQESEEKN